MKHLSVVLILSVLVSCGGSPGNSKNKQRQEKNPRNCLESDALCMPSTLWIIDSGSRVIPKNIELEINDNTVFDTCRGDAASVMPDGEGHQILSLKTLGAIKDSETVALKITDKGEDCKDQKPFYMDRALVLHPTRHYEENDFFVSQKVSIRLKD